jgi:hypothetical protein
LSRSSITNRYGASADITSRNCCTVQGAVGCSVTFQCTIRRVPTSRTRDTPNPRPIAPLAAGREPTCVSRRLGLTPRLSLSLSLDRAALAASRFRARTHKLQASRLKGLMANFHEACAALPPAWPTGRSTCASSSVMSKERTKCSIAECDHARRRADRCRWRSRQPMFLLHDRSRRDLRRLVRHQSSRTLGLLDM